MSARPGKEQSHHRSRLLHDALHFSHPDSHRITDSINHRLDEFFHVTLKKWFRRKVEKGQEPGEKHHDFYNTLKYLFPVIQKFEGYNFGVFGQDILAAITVTVVIIPQALAYSSLAKVQPINALLSATIPLFIYGLFGSSNQLSVGPEALSSVLVGIAVTEISEQTGIDTSSLASTLAFLVGLFTVILALLRAGFIDNILSGYLLTGFVTGVAVLIITEQLPNLLGLIYIPPTGEVSTLQKLIFTCEKFHTANPAAVAIGLSNAAFLIIIQRLKKFFVYRRFKFARYFQLVPEVFILVVIMIILSATIDFKRFSVKILGTFENHLLAPKLPPLSGELVQKLLESAIVIVVVGYIESQTVTRNFGLKNNYFPSGDRELFALGAANVVGSVFGAYVTFGSLPRSRILANAGGKTTLAGIFVATLVLIAILVLGPVLSYLPKPTLAAIVFVAAYNLIEWGEIFFVFRVHGYLEIFFMIATFAISFVTPISNGIILCLIFAGLIIVRHSAKAELMILGRVPLQNVATPSINENSSVLSESGPMYRYVDVKEHPEAIIYENLLIVGIDSPLLFYNAGGLRRSLQTLLMTERIILHKRAELCSPVTLVSDDTLTSINMDGEASKCGLRESDTVHDLIKEANSKGISSGTITDEEFHEEIVEEKSGEGSMCDDDGKKKHAYTIVFSFKYCTEMDSAAAHTFRVIIRSFLAHGTKVYFTNLHTYHRKVLDKAGVIKLIGSDNVYDSLDEAVREVVGN